MYETYGLRPEDFRTVWPHQLKALLVVSAELQSQCKILHEYSALSTSVAAQELQNARSTLSGEVGRIIERSRDAHAESCKALSGASSTLVKEFQSYLFKHSQLLERIEVRSSELTKQEIALQNRRIQFRHMPVWRRVWIALFAKGI